MSEEVINKRSSDGYLASLFINKRSACKVDTDNITSDRPNVYVGQNNCSSV